MGNGAVCLASRAASAQAGDVGAGVDADLLDEARRLPVLRKQTAWTLRRLRQIRWPRPAPSVRSSRRITPTVHAVSNMQRNRTGVIRRMMLCSFLTRLSPAIGYHTKVTASSPEGCHMVIIVDMLSRRFRGRDKHVNQTSRRSWGRPCRARRRSSRSAGSSA